MRMTPILTIIGLMMATMLQGSVFAGDYDVKTGGAGVDIVAKGTTQPVILHLESGGKWTDGKLTTNVTVKSATQDGAGKLKLDFTFDKDGGTVDVWGVMPADVATSDDTVQVAPKKVTRIVGKGEGSAVVTIPKSSTTRPAQ